MPEPETFRQRFRLHASLGGGEYEGIANGAYVILDIPVLGAVPFEAKLVTRVVPTDPGDGSWVAVAPADRSLPPYVFSRHADAPNPERPWWWHDNQDWVPWSDVHELGLPRRIGVTGAIAPFQGSKGICSVCGKSRSVRIDGRVANHPHRGPRCEGSNRKPASGVPHA